MSEVVRYHAEDSWDAADGDFVYHSNYAALEQGYRQMREALRIARAAIKIFHGPTAWDIYEHGAPEMKQIAVALECADKLLGKAATDKPCR